MMVDVQVVNMGFRLTILFLGVWNDYDCLVTHVKKTMYFRTNSVYDVKQTTLPHQICVDNLVRSNRNIVTAKLTGITASDNVTAVIRSYAAM